MLRVASYGRDAAVLRREHDASDEIKLMDLGSVPTMQLEYLIVRKPFRRSDSVSINLAFCRYWSCLYSKVSMRMRVSFMTHSVSTFCVLHYGNIIKGISGNSTGRGSAPSSSRTLALLGRLGQRSLRSVRTRARSSGTLIRLGTRILYELAVSMVQHRAVRHGERPRSRVVCILLGFRKRHLHGVWPMTDESVTACSGEDPTFPHFSQDGKCPEHFQLFACLMTQELDGFGITERCTPSFVECAEQFFIRLVQRIQGCDSTT